MKKINLSLLQKIVYLSLALVIFGASVVGFGVYKTNTVIDKFSHVADINLPNAGAMANMLASQKDIYTYLLYWEQNGKKESDKKIIEENIAAYIKGDKWYQDIPFVDGEAEIYKAVDDSWKAFKNEVDNHLNGKPSEKKLLELYLDFDKKMQVLINFQGNQGKIWSQDAKSVAHNALYVQIIMLIVLMVISTIISVSIGRGIVSKIQSAIDSLKGSSTLVASAATEIAATAEGLSEATTEQASSIQETSSSLEEISKMVNQNTENSKNAKIISEESLKSASNGKIVVDKMINAISDIGDSNVQLADQVNSTNIEINKIVEIITEVGNKTKVINDIVFQTKLLSFNASVEAARAGEHGKGFAVVAEEVGSLAKMSGEAAIEISNMLDESLKTVNEIVKNSKVKIEDTVNTSRSKVDVGTVVAKECEQAFNKIYHDTSSISSMISEIADASVEQSQGVSEINKAIAQLDQVTHENASKAQESASAASTLSNQTEQLNLAVNVLVETVSGRVSA